MHRHLHVLEECLICVPFWKRRGQVLLFLWDVSLMVWMSAQLPLFCSLAWALFCSHCSHIPLAHDGRVSFSLVGARNVVFFFDVLF